MPHAALSLHDSLHQIFGFRDFRPHQEEAVAAALQGKDVLVVMPTGAGKSLTFQLPAAITPGVTLVISPLIALMRDQVTALREKTGFASIGTAYLNSSQTQDEQRDIVGLLRAGHIKLLYIAPERLRSTAFVDLLSDLQLARFVVDEAHCISEWGHDFRPDYLTIGDVLAVLGRPPLMAVTATATQRVQSSIVHNLGMRDPSILIGGFNRPNLHLAAHRCRNDAERGARLQKALPRLVARGGSGLIYCSTRRQCEEVAHLANQALKTTGQRAAIYHAGLDVNARNESQQGWLEGQVSVLVATNAFGMGIDKSDVRFVIHWGYPESPESYYQEAGRAGRDGRKSRCVILSSGTADRKLREFFIDNEALTGADLARVLKKLAGLGDDVVRVPRHWWEAEFEWRDPRPRVVLGKLERAGLIEKLSDNNEFVALRVLRRELTPRQLAELSADLDREREVRYARLDEMQSYVRSSGCRRRALLGYFGDHDYVVSEFCCDNCDRGAHGGTNEGRAAPAELPAGRVPPPAHVESAHEFLQALDALHPPVGKARLARALRGSSAEDVKKYAQMAAFGSLRHLSVAAVGHFLDDLVQRGLLHHGDEDEYFVVRVTRPGREAWQNAAPLGFDLPRTGVRSPGASGRGSGGPSREASDLNEESEELFQNLRAWRRQQAGQDGVPPYLVFSDKVLMEIAAVQPANLDELLRVSGIGEAKLERYGQAVLRVLQADGAVPT